MHSMRFSYYLDGSSQENPSCTRKKGTTPISYDFRMRDSVKIRSHEVRNRLLKYMVFPE
jgi:hypothetical protein